MQYTSVDRYPDLYIALVCNPLLKNIESNKIIRTVRLFLTSSGIKHSWFIKVWPPDFASFTQVWIVGGDGTLNFFINRYPEITIPLSILPAGTGNDFHWALYQGATLQQQLNKAVINKPVLVDAGECNGRLFLNGAGIGFDGAVVRDLLKKRNKKGKRAYVTSVLNNLFFFRSFPVNFQGSKDKLCFMISIANGKRYGGNFIVAPEANLYDGLLEVSEISDLPVFARLKNLPLMIRGGHLTLSFVSYSKMEYGIITAPIKLPAHLDGEYFEDTEFRFRVLPKRFSFL